MRSDRRTLSASDGFTLVEVLVAMVILLLGVMGTLTLIDRANATTSKTRTREAAVNLAREVVEAARSVPYPSLTPASVQTEIQGLPGLADDNTADTAWTIRRRDVTFTVSATVCTFDDARDGAGTHVAGGFCTDSATAATLTDRNPEDYRRVRVEVRWTEHDSGIARSVTQTELINNPGSAGAPAVRTLVIRPASATIAPATGHVTAAGSTHTLTFDLTTSSRPETLHWLLDGTSQEPIGTGGDLAWSFEWKLGDPAVATSVLDGTYVIAAEAFDSYGVAGPSRSLTVMVNRALPDKVGGLVGGRNGDPAAPQDQFVDLEWLPSRARDIIGYSVERVSSSGTQEVCARAAVVRCIDPDPPVEAGLRYRVYAWDANHVDNQPRKAAVPSDDLVVNLDNRPPVAPANHTATLQADGSVTLNWTRPAPVEDPDTGDRIAFWRIYRDGTGTADRYAVWDDPDTVAEFIDSNTGGTAHDYWVTAVDTRYAESAPVKAVWSP